MREICGFAGSDRSDRAEQEIFSGAANFYARIARDFERRGERDRSAARFLPQRA